ncbi:hypothetical protein [Vibrio campbellii]|uniref:hypothetical protein n=1 Tax=Vibrio campbellii TaxID=680 RepID=UPI00385787FC
MNILGFILMAIKSVWVKAPFKEKGYWDKQQVQVGSELKEVPKGLLRKKQLEDVPVFEEQDVWVRTSFSDKEIDGEKFNKEIEEAVSELDATGFSIVSITPVISGQYAHDSGTFSNGGWGYGYGYSYTEGVTILAQSK